MTNENMNIIPSNESSVLPPLPLSRSELTDHVNGYQSCTFDYLPESIRLYVKDAYDVISRNEWWGPFRSVLLERGVDQTTGFIFNSNPLFRTIMNAVCSTEIGNGHSGCSIGFVMREMEFIALNGEPAYRERVFQYQR